VKKYLLAGISPSTYDADMVPSTPPSGVPRDLVLLHAAPLHHRDISGLKVAITQCLDGLHRMGVQIGLISTSSCGRYEHRSEYMVRDARDLPIFRPISSLPAPFNEPDLVILHSTYIPRHLPIVIKAVRRGIPYLILPHGGMTPTAQSVKRTKKLVGNLLFFDHIGRNDLNATFLYRA
jgi:hypothetical protein